MSNAKQEQYVKFSAVVPGSKIHHAIIRTSKVESGVWGKAACGVRIWCNERARARTVEARPCKICALKFPQWAQGKGI